MYGPCFVVDSHVAVSGSSDSIVLSSSIGLSSLAESEADLHETDPDAVVVDGTDSVVVTETSENSEVTPGPLSLSSSADPDPSHPSLSSPSLDSSTTSDPLVVSQDIVASASLTSDEEVDRVLRMTVRGMDEETEAMSESARHRRREGKVGRRRSRSKRMSASISAVDGQSYSGSSSERRDVVTRSKSAKKGRRRLSGVSDYLAMRRARVGSFPYPDFDDHFASPFESRKVDRSNAIVPSSAAEAHGTPFSLL